MSDDEYASLVVEAWKAHAGSLPLDEDTQEYCHSLLSENPYDEDAREAVTALVTGSLDDDDDDDDNPVDATTCLANLFDHLDQMRASSDASAERHSPEATTTTLRKLDQAVTMKESDVQTFASGLSAQQDSLLPSEHAPTDDPGSGTSKIQHFYANMIGIATESALSERLRRKLRQKELREQMEEAERQRAVQEAMALLENLTVNKDDHADPNDDAHEKDSHAQDVHLENFDLPNLRGGGPNLLEHASLTLARGRRYGLMGRNGCGKTTLLSFLSKRQVPGIPKHMTMLLVRQEIMGNDWTAVETVLKSDVKRESAKRFIAYCEQKVTELEQQQQEEESKDDAPTPATPATPPPLQSKPKGGKDRQKLRDRKKQNMQKAAAKAVVDQQQKAAPAAASLEQIKTEWLEKLAAAYQRLAQIEQEEGGDPEPRARKVLQGLGFTTDMQDKPTSELSGGWRMRVSLSCALFANPSLLCLDEPTNHLDLEAVLWLEKYLTTQFTGTLVVVSHDRHFLNQVVTDVVHFHKQQLTCYRGDITNYEAVRADDRLRQARLRAVQESKRQQLQKYIDLHAQAGENGPKAAKQRKSKMKKMDKLGVMAQDGKKYKASYDGDAKEVEEVEEDETVRLLFPDPGGFDGEMIRLEEAQFGYSPDKILLESVDLSITLKSRIALLGRNGCGKSTLIKLVVGALRPLKGKVAIDRGARIEYLAQHQLEQLDPDGTPLSTMVDRYPGDHSNSHIGELRRYLANFGLGGEILPNQQIHTMSGGQKCRVCLACAMYRKPHLLILDEPTNHLDLETTEALIEAIREFQGGVLLVSHDQHLLTSVCKDLLVVEKGQVERLTHGISNQEAFEQYKKAVVLGRR